MNKINNSGPEAFHESRSVMTFLTNLGVTVYSFRLVLEGKEIRESSRLEFLETFLAKCNIPQWMFFTLQMYKWHKIA